MLTKYTLMPIPRLTAGVTLHMPTMAGTLWMRGLSVMDTLALEVTLLFNRRVCRMDVKEMAVAGGSTMRAWPPARPRAAVTMLVSFWPHYLTCVGGTQDVQISHILHLDNLLPCRRDRAKV